MAVPQVAGLPAGAAAVFPSALAQPSPADLEIGDTADWEVWVRFASRFPFGGEILLRIEQDLQNGLFGGEGDLLKLGRAVLARENFEEPGINFVARGGVDSRARGESRKRLIWAKNGVR